MSELTVKDYVFKKGAAKRIPVSGTFELTSRCNFRCTMCYVRLNPEEAARQGKLLPADQWIEIARQAKDLGVLYLTLTGGEPLLQPDIADFIHRVRAHGYAVKLDTNGSFPEKLAALIDEGLLDYIAMDIKNAPAKYEETAGSKGILEKVQASVALLLTNKVDYEFRTTVTAQLHNEDSFADIALWLRGAKQFAIQNFRDSGDILSPGLSPCSPDQLRRFESILRPHMDSVLLRGDLT